jgi:LacI family transcriptional regulator
MKTITKAPTPRRTTLLDVAERAGVDKATVSQVINHRPNCWASQATRARILEAVNDLGYRANLSARALRNGVSHVIGVVAPGAILNRTMGLTEAAAQAEYTVALSSHHNDSESEDVVIRRLVDRGIDGLAVYPVDRGPHNELRRLVESGFPVVTFDGAHLLSFPCDDISVDYREVGRLQARHLLELGRRRPCLVSPRPEAPINAIREAAVIEEFRQAVVSPLVMTVERSTTREIADPGALILQIREFLQRHAGEYDAMVGFDAMASLSVRVLQTLGLRIPEDVAVVGSGDGVLAGYGVLPLTSISTVDDQAGAQAFALLMDRIAGRAAGPFRRLTNPATLIARESTGGPGGTMEQTGRKP